jgi:hypothetical protein
VARINIPGFQCERCGHKWIMRSSLQLGAHPTTYSGPADNSGISDDDDSGVPKICPHCKSKLWDVPVSAHDDARTTRRKPWDNGLITLEAIFEPEIGSESSSLDPLLKKLRPNRSRDLNGDS